MQTVVNGISMHVRLHGPANGPRLLFIHGFPLTGAMWEPLVEPLGGEYRLIIPDLRGFGESELSSNHQPGDGPPMSIAQYADDLFVMLETLGEPYGEDPLVVIGLSMGGYIALEFFRRYTSSVRAMALVDTRAQGDPPQRIQERIDTAKRVLDEGSVVVANAMVDRLFAPQTPAARREFWHAIMARQKREAIAAALFAMAGRGSYLDMLHTILCPTLVAGGEKDIITPREDAELIQRSIPMSELCVIAEAGHMSPPEQPRAFAGALNEFLRRHRVFA